VIIDLYVLDVYLELVCYLSLICFLNCCRYLFCGQCYKTESGKR